MIRNKYAYSLRTMLCAVLLCAIASAIARLNVVEVRSVRQEVERHVFSLYAVTQKYELVWLFVACVAAIVCFNLTSWEGRILALGCVVAGLSGVAANMLTALGVF